MRFWITFLLNSFSLLFTLHFYCNAQELGSYPIRNFNHREYGGLTQNWAIVQDQRGLIYVANNDGVLEYDGSDWRQISINRALSRCLDIDKEGRIWVGGQDEVGYLAADSTGTMAYFSLVKMIPSYNLPFGLVKQIFATDDGVYFCSNQSLILIKQNKIKVWKPKTVFHRSFFANGKLFVNQPEYGLTYLKGDSLKLVPRTEDVSRKLVYVLLPYSKDKILIGSQSDGFYLYNLNALRADTTILKDSTIYRVTTKNEGFFKENMIYSGLTLPNNEFAIGTYRKGAVIIDKRGTIIREINRKSGLQDEAVWNLCLDSHSNLWMALNNGLSYTSTNSQLTSWGEDSGLRGTLQSVIRFNNNLYVTSNIGLFRMVDGSLKEVKGFTKFSFKLLKATGSDGKSSLLVGAIDGLYAVEGDNVRKLENIKTASYTFCPSKIFPNIIYVGTDGIGVLKYQNGEWIYLGKFEETKGPVYSITEDQNGYLWFSERYKGVHKCNVVNPYQLVMEHINFYGQLPYSPRFDDMSISFIDGSIKVSTDKGLCRYVEKRDCFIPDSSLGVEFTDGQTGIRILDQDKKGNLWFEAYRLNPNHWIERAVKFPDKTYRRVPAQFRTIPDMIFNDVLSEDNDINWIAASDGLYRFDGSVNRESQIIMKLLIRKVIVNQTKVVFSGASPLNVKDSYFRLTNFSQTNNLVRRLHSSENSIIFYFSSPFFGQTQKMKYSYFLEGYDKTWSSWNTDQKKEYTNLPYGSYKFIVKAKNVFDTESPIASYTFYIKRPWYLSPLSFVLYIFIIAALFWVFVAIKTNLLKGSNIRLQALVEERTKELVQFQKDIVEKNEELMQQKEEMQVQRDELHEQNRQTSASLEYAKTIQQAILPDLNALRDRFEHFVIYKPKDVVSGDFYWISRVISKTKQTERIYVAVVDCTGHGVPGAFMSMIGSRMLSEIVNERKLQSPADILTELNHSINQALRQDVSESFDGMDACLCLIEHKISNQYLVTFAGANRALYYYQKGTHKIQALRGNRKTIGGIMPDVDAEFVNNRIYLSPGDILFLNSDGIVDQNNEDRKKYTASRFHASLLANINLSMEEMGREVDNSFEDYRGNAFQRDDITVLGLRFLEEDSYK